MSIIRYAAMAASGLLLSAVSAFAAPIIFATSEGVQPSDVGIITLTQVDANTVNVLVDLNDTALPDPQYGFINTGGPHTPFAFNLAGTEIGVTATFIQPPLGVFSFGLLTLSTADGGATPFGTYGISINSSAGNGSGDAYYGDLQFNVTRATGLLTTDFVANGEGYFFAADLTNGNEFGDTGSQAWKTSVTPGGQCTNPPCSDVPVPGPIVGAGLPGLIVACLGLVGLARRRRKAAIA